MGINQWSALDLRSRSVFGPFDDELICLHLIPKSRNYSERFLVGKMITEEGKTWFKQLMDIGGRDVAKMRKHYTIEWSHLPPTDRKEVTTWNL